MRLFRRILGWVLMILGVWIALYPVGIALQALGSSMMGKTFVIDVGHVVALSIESVVFGALLFLLGRWLKRGAAPDAAAMADPSE